MSNYPARYAAICERWPELHAGVEYDNDAKCWHSGDYGELERNALALIRARLQDAMDDDIVPKDLDALLAWWENRK